ncbi:MAG TPA: hypothetical protein VKG26_15465, partial [Bacteroidia bacterium]|nr:hypothetical protein [Bacteroidia bacterium]
EDQRLLRPHAKESKASASESSDAYTGDIGSTGGEKKGLFKKKSSSKEDKDLEIKLKLYELQLKLFEMQFLTQ